MSRKDRGRRGGKFNTSRFQIGIREPDRRAWPIVRAYVPMEEAWEVSGWGTAGIVRRQPDGKLTNSLFMIDLSSGGLMEAFGAENRTDEELEANSADMIDLLPPFVTGEADLAARYVWGAYAMSLAEGAIWSPELSQRHLSMLPTIGGTKKWWLQQFIGSGGLVPEGLFEVIAKILEAGEMPEGKEALTAVSMEFDLAATDRLIDALRGRPGEFEEFNPVPEAVSFHWMRERTGVPGEWAAHALIGVMKGEVFGHTANLSMAGMLVAELKKLTEGAIELKEVEWGGMEELMIVPPGLTAVE
ncbi:MAG TPA: hypothetical protein VGQ99_08235 [Tepidisphaeraceae bacterium]|nr:hypothetical protein [Tepidisphaeraceae bacterium]